MQKNSIVAGVCLAGWASLVHSPAQAQDPLGLYVGVGGGHSDVRTSSDELGQFVRFDKSNTAWQAFLGIRPIPFLGAEISYSWLGDPHGAFPYAPDGGTPGSEARQTAAAAFGVAYLPLGVFDLYAKLGAARLHTEATEGPVQLASCPPRAFCPVLSDLGFVDATFRQNLWDTDLAYGVGAQVHAGPLGARLDYLRYQASYGHPDLVTLGLFLRF